MRRNGRLFWILVAMTALCLGGYSWAKGKPGGGGGNGGGGDPPPAGFIYARTCTPIKSFAYGDCNNHKVRSILMDGTIDEELTFTNMGHPSFDVHAGERYFLVIADAGTNNPDGSPRSILKAKSESNSNHDLLDGTDDMRINGGVRWTKDDAAVSFTATVWDGGGTASMHIFYAEVSWSAGGVPSLVSGPDAIIDEAAGESLTDGFAGGHDWSPDGTRLVYVENDGTDDVIKLATFSLSTNPPSLDSIDELGEGWDPRWSPETDIEQIAFVRNWVVYASDSDGAGESQLSGSGDERHSPRWSPDGQHVAFGRTKDIKIKGSSNFTVDVMVVAASGGTAQNITGGDSDRYELFGWRN